MFNRDSVYSAENPIISSNLISLKIDITKFSISGTARYYDKRSNRLAASGGRNHRHEITISTRYTTFEMCFAHLNVGIKNPFVNSYDWGPFNFASLRIEGETRTRKLDWIFIK